MLPYQTRAEEDEVVADHVVADVGAAVDLIERAFADTEEDPKAE